VNSKHIQKAEKGKTTGLASDHASNITSSKDAGITNRYSQEFPYLVITHDICHALNLVLSNAIETFSK